MANGDVFLSELEAMPAAYPTATSDIGSMV